MRVLLPNKFKLIGAIMSPLALATWLAGQLGYLTLFLASWPTSRALRMSVLGSAVFAFMFGMYFVAFSKEKVEDEMIQRIRLDSFMFAAYVQMAVVFAFFLSCLFIGDPKQGGFELFLIGTILLFWVSYLLRFNYTVHLNYGVWKTE